MSTHTLEHPMYRLTPKLVILTAIVAAVGCDTTEPPLPEDPCKDTTPITLGQSLSGQLDVDDCQQPDGAYADRWSLELTSQTSVRIDLRSSAFDAYLELRTAAGVVLMENDDAGSYDSRIIHTLSAGSYVIVARSLGPAQAGSYRLSVEVGPDCSPVGDLELGVAVSGSLTASDCIFEWGGAMDNWSLTLDRTETLRFEVASSDVDEIVLLRDPSGYIVNGADWNGPNGCARFEMEVNPGTWTVSTATPFEGQFGSYELLVDVRPACNPGTDLVIGETVSGVIDLDDCLFDGWNPADSFALVLDAETALDILLKSPDFQPVVIVRNPATGMDEAFGFDTAQTGSARIRTTLAPGTYSLFAWGTSYAGPGLGSYELTVSEAVCEAPTPIAFGTTESGTLEGADCVRASGAYQDRWTLVLDAETPTRIDLTSAQFDAYLVLKDDAGNPVTTNDDGGSGTNARIDTTLAAGTWEIVASSFAPGQMGAYSLSVGAPPATQVASLEPGVGDGPDIVKSVPTDPTPDAFHLTLESWKQRAGSWVGQPREKTR
jgi:hypothetical protein